MRLMKPRKCEIDISSPRFPDGPDAADGLFYGVYQRANGFNDKPVAVIEMNGELKEVHVEKVKALEPYESE